MDMVPWQIEYDPEVMEDLRERLSRTRWPGTMGEGWEYGTNQEYLQGLTAYWTRGFDWKAQVERLNRLPHFRAVIDGIGIHFVHQRGKGPQPLPLIITHGWPGSFYEMLKLIPRLADPASFGGDPADAFDVVVPSLPGYGFSDPPRARGLDPEQIAGLWRHLMVDGLGYDRFGAQGGDWGASVSTRLALLAPQQLVGVHLNYLPGSYRPYLRPGAERLTQAEALFLEGCQEWDEAEGGYAHIQRTKPQTVAYGLHDSPVGLLAWIVEKLRSWSDCDGELERRWNRDELLTAVMLYWTTGAIGSSMRLYRDAARKPLWFGDGEGVRVPCGMAVFPAETPANPPREWVERCYDIRHWTEMPRGGHFPAWEEPELLARDIRDFFRTLR